MKLKLNHSWNISLIQAKELQQKLNKKINFNSVFTSINEIKTIAGCDVHFNDLKAVAGLVIMTFPGLELIDKFRIEKITDENFFPYVPEYLAFREGPILIELFKKISFQPDVVLFDGQGIAHPRKMGIATHLGILFDIPTIGCAKNLLYGNFTDLGQHKGAKSYLRDSNTEILGVALRTKSFVKPVFVSPGNKINLDLSAEIILSCCKKYRLPEPLRYAHLLSFFSAKRM